MEIIPITVNAGRFAAAGKRLMAGDTCVLALSGLHEGVGASALRLTLAAPGRGILAACSVFAAGVEAGTAEGTLALATRELAEHLSGVPTGVSRRVSFAVWLAGSGEVLGSGFAEIVALPFGEDYSPLPAVTHYIDAAELAALVVAPNPAAATGEIAGARATGEALALKADAADTYTKAETDDAINAIAAYYITSDAAGAAFPTRSALLGAQTYYSGGSARTPTRNDYAVVLADETHSGAEWRYIYAVPTGAAAGQWEAQYPIETNDYAALANKPKIGGVELSGNKTPAALDLAAASDLRYALAAPQGEEGSESIFVLADRAVNRVAFPSGETRNVFLRLPPAVAGRARDLLVRLEIPDNSAPDLVEILPAAGETAAFETEDGALPDLTSPGTYLISMTETAAGVFAVAARALVEVE